MDMQLHGINVSVADADVARIVERHLRGEQANDVPMPYQCKRPLPEIGQPFEGGIYAGLTIYQNKPMALVLLPGDVEKNWKDAMDWAAEGELPTRMDALVLWQNLPDEFEKRWYWTQETYASDSDYAWYQYFNYGFQDFNFKDNYYRARAVRRLSIE